MKILVLSHVFFPSIGGIEVNTEILTRNFKKYGHEVILLTNTETNENDEDFKFKIIRKPSFIRTLKLFIWSDVVFHNNPSFGLGYLSIFFNYKTIYAIRTWVARIDKSLTFKDKLKQKIICMGKNRIFISKAVKDHLFCDGKVIGNPYRNDIFFHKNLHIEKNNFIYAGRLASDKGVDLLLEAYSKLKRKYKLDGISIAGDGIEKENLINLAKKLDIIDEVNFLGFVKGENLATEYRKHKFLVVPSRWKEPFGNVALEGLACGCFPIVSEGGGLSDAIGKCGLTFKNGSLESLIEQIELSLTSNKIINNARSKVYNHLLKHQESYVSNQYLKVLKGE